MFIKEIQNKINSFIEGGCKGTVFGYSRSDKGEYDIYEIQDIVYRHDLIEAGTEGVYIEVCKHNIPTDTNINNISYGSILKITGLTSNFKDDIDTVMLVNNITGGSNYNCKVLDLSTYELISDFESIEDFKKTVNIIEVVRNTN